MSKRPHVAQNYSIACGAQPSVGLRFLQHATVLSILGQGQGEGASVRQRDTSSLKVYAFCFLSEQGTWCEFVGLLYTDVNTLRRNELMLHCNMVPLHEPKMGSVVVLLHDFSIDDWIISHKLHVHMSSSSTFRTCR